MAMNGPIPGQSLTRTPRNALYERPPEIVEPNDAIMYHIRKLSEPERIDNLLFTLEYGLPVRHATQAALTTAVAQGIHNIDISLIIAPVVHKYIVSLAEQAGVPYKDDFDNAEMREEDERNKIRILLTQAMEETPVEERDAGYEMLGEFAEAVPEMDVSQETEGEVAPEVEELAEAVEEKPQEKPRGLMAKGQ